MKNFSIEPACPDDVKRVTGESLPYTSHLFEVKAENEIIGFIGYYRKHTYLVLYAHIEPHVQKQLKRYRRAVILAYREMMKQLEKQPLPVYSYADEEAEGSERLLRHIGFEPHNGRVYRWHG
jgi:hypothetical protein